MKQILKLVFLLVLGQTALAQAPSNYTNINGRYRWIAGMFDSTFHIPKGTTPSLRTGGSTNAGGLFYNTGDSSVYTYTGTQWIKVRGSINPSDTTNKYVTQVYKKNASDSVFYVKGGNHLFAFIDSVGSPGGGGGGKVYYFNGGVDMGTIGGLQMYELGDTANTGAAANFTRSTTGNIANFITDAGKPGLLQIPAGVWSVDAWLSETGGGANHAEIWIEVEKWDGSTITTIATSPIEQITEGGTPNLYSWSVSIPTTSLTVTDRIIIQFYISNTNGKTVTLYTQNGYVGEVHTTFTTGIGAINGLTAPAQYLVTGTSGTDFNINSATATHTFNLPTASATNRGALSSADWSTFNNKQSAITLTTTGTSGAATLVGATLNIPQYQSALTNPVTGTGVNNQAAFFTGTNTIAGSSVLVIDGSNIAIGQAAAAQKLSVNGDVSIATINNATTDTDKFLVSDGGVIKYRTGSEVLSDIGAASSTSISGTTNYIPKFTSSSAIGNSVIYESGGSIGIGTASPSTLYGLTLNGNTTTNTGGIIIKQSGTDVLYFGNIATTNDTDFEIWNPRNGFLRFATNNAERMRLDASGRLGIGTTSPSNILHLYKASEPEIYLQSSGATFRTGLNSDNEYFVYSANAKAIYFANNGSERMRLDASGNLGLGVTPSAWQTMVGLQVGDVGSIGSKRFSAGNSQSFFGNNVYYDNGGFKYIATDPASMLRFVNNEMQFNIAGSGSANGTISFTQAMTLDASGRLGIGTTSPSTLLQVNGTITIGTLSSGSDAILSFANNASGAPRTIYYKASTAALNFTSTGGSDLMTLTNGGNVGIGTSSPATISGYTIVDIQNATNGGLIQLGTNGTGYGQLYNNTGEVQLRTISTIPLVFGTNSAERMRITSGGNVGIGTTSPQSILHLETSSGNGSAIRMVSTSTNGRSYAIGSNFVTGNGEFAIYDYTAAATRLWISSTGNTGIGTTSPSEKLEVNGAIKTAAPSGGTAVPWKLGDKLSTAVTLDTGNYIPVEVNGVTYYLALVTLN